MAPPQNLAGSIMRRLGLLKIISFEEGACPDGADGTREGSVSIDGSGDRSMSIGDACDDDDDEEAVMSLGLG